MLKLAYLRAEEFFRDLGNEARDAMFSASYACTITLAKERAKVAWSLALKARRAAQEVL